MSINTAIEYIKANPRATAKEAGLSNAEVNALVGQGKLMQAGKRMTGKKGKPPYEYARERVNAHRLYERMSNAIMRAANEFGHGSEQHVDAKLLRLESFTVLPSLPSKNDYVLAGVIAEDTDLPALLPGEDAGEDD
jgi:hypothetical protein